MTRTCTLFTLALAGMLGVTSQAHAFRIRLGCLRPVVCRPVLPCGIGLFGCRLPALLDCCRSVIAAPPISVNPLPPPVVVPPMPPAAPTALPAPAPIVSVPSQFGPVPVAPVPQPPVIVAPAPVVAAPAIMTHEEFARVFRPLPGRYEVTLIHPGSRRPVPVCFTLPDGCPRVRVHRRELVFDYGRHEVEIRFQLGGRVRVTSR
ncbi:MAG: hypothetical protein IT429_13780 [Gemmataceae bacterium]|nr:hypothetical protein [Gemmataceae bacterium]